MTNSLKRGEIWLANLNPTGSSVIVMQIIN